MSKTHRPAFPPPPTLVAVTDRQGDVLIGPSERARLRAVTAHQDQREARARREARQLIEAADRLTTAPCPEIRPYRRSPVATGSAPFGRIAATIFVALVAFIAGLMVGRL